MHATEKNSDREKETEREREILRMKEREGVSKHGHKDYFLFMKFHSFHKVRKRVSE